jgi:hypothetical protein
MQWRGDPLLGWSQSADAAAAPGSASRDCRKDCDWSVSSALHNQLTRRLLQVPHHVTAERIVIGHHHLLHNHLTRPLHQVPQLR